MKIQFISSAQNPQMKLLKSLQNRKGRREQELFIVEGSRLTKEVCDPWQIETLVLTEGFYERETDWQEIANRYPEARIYVVPEELFVGIADTQHPQGILAAVRIRRFSIEELLREENPFLIILEEVQDPGNAGTILRTADAAGADGILCSKGTVDFFSPKTVRASMGSIFHIPVVVAEDFESELRMLKKRGIRLLAAHLQGSRPHFEADYTRGCAVMIGNEGNGLSAEAAAMADERVRIPQPGRAESLNASVAAGILIYEALRQRTIKYEEEALCT